MHRLMEMNSCVRVDKSRQQQQTGVLPHIASIIEFEEKNRSGQMIEIENVILFALAVCATGDDSQCRYTRKW